MQPVTLDPKKRKEAKKMFSFMNLSMIAEPCKLLQCHFVCDFLCMCFIAHPCVCSFLIDCDCRHILHIPPSRAPHRWPNSHDFLFHIIGFLRLHYK